MIAPDCKDPELPLRLKAAATTVNRDSVEELCQLLGGRGWTTAKEILRLRPNWPRGEQGKRFVRLLANAAGDRITSGPGTPGYILTERIPLHELEHAERSMRSQIRKMLQRCIGWRYIANRRREIEARLSGGNK